MKKDHEKDIGRPLKVNLTGMVFGRCHKDLIRQRIKARGWSVEKALTTPIPK